jgi:activating signal cointegrator 1
MKALSLTQPWAQLVVLGEKQFETRSWCTRYRGLLAIQASKGFPGWAKDLLNARQFAQSLGLFGINKSLPLGAIVGMVELTNCIDASIVLGRLTDKEITFGNWSPERWAWQLKNPEMLLNPIPCKGALGLWEVPAEIEQQIYEQIPWVGVSK